MELYQIKHFIAVAETGGFTKGAQRVAISQPAISASIAKLEAELDVQLLDRRRSPVVPTAAGTRLLEAGKNILQTCNAVKAELKTITTPNLQDRRPAVAFQRVRLQAAKLFPACQRPCGH